MCTPVKQYVQKQRMVMQKQQQEAMARKEAEARGYNPHMMQQVLACTHQQQSQCSYELTVHSSNLMCPF